MRPRLLSGSALRIGLVGAVLLAAAPAAQAGVGGPGPEAVFLRLASYAPGGYDNTVANLRTALASAGWTVVGDYEAGVDRKACAYRARVLVVHWPEYAASVLQGSNEGAFAAALRFAVYEDESGVHVSVVNPRSVGRTIVAERGREADWAKFAERIEAVVHARLPGATAGYGQLRTEGRIGKTMGVMAGGPFPEKVKLVAAVPLGGQTVEAVARRLETGLARQGDTGEWRLRPAYLLNTGVRDVVVLGLTGGPVESKSFQIVGKGGDARRASMACPGVDHAAAYPLELVLVKEGDQVRVLTVDEMFRMKLYFEDAGMMAFAKNMGMPGSIGAELRRKVAAALAPAT